MQLTDFLLVLGAGALAAALRSYQHPVFHKLGSVMVLVTSFLIGYLPTGSWLVGFALASTWFFLPWIELIARVRKLKLPVPSHMEKRFPPPRDVFPDLHELTGELRQHGFELEYDTGWEGDGHSQFFRIMYHPDRKLQGCICLVQQMNLAYSYLSFTSRKSDDSLWTTWNYPFSYSLKVPPGITINRHPPESSPSDVMESHSSFLLQNGIGKEGLKDIDPETIQDHFLKDFTRQIEHNLQTGVLYKTGEGDVKYTWRGLFFLWTQFLRDLVRL